MASIFQKINPMNIFKGGNKQKIEVEKAPSANAGAMQFHNRGSMTGGAKYQFGLSNLGYSKLISSKRVGQNARYAFHDSPEAKAVVGRFVDTVVGEGLKLESTPEAEVLGITPEEAEKWSKNVERRFNIWAKSKKVHRSGMLNFYQLQKLYQLSQQRDNDIFVRLYYSKSSNKKKKTLSNLQLSMIDPNQIPGCGYTSTYTNGGRSQDGIKRNDRGEEISYKINVINQDGTSKEVEIPKYGQRSGRLMMIHSFIPEYAGQQRGYSRLEGILQEFEDITDLKTSKIKKAISQSQISLYTKPSDENDASNPLEDLMNGVSGPMNDVSVDNPSDVTGDYDGPLVTWDRIPEAEFNVPGGIGVFNLKKGEDLKAFEGNSENEEFKGFIEAYMSYVAASKSMPLEVLLMKFGQNYSASRGALILFWQVVKMFRTEQATDFLNPVFEMWLAEEIAEGRIEAPGFEDPILREAWLSCNWIGSPMPNIDPLKSAKADKEYASMGATTLDRIAREYNGSDGSANRRRLEKETEELVHMKWTMNPDVSNNDEISDESEMEVEEDSE